MFAIPLISSAKRVSIVYIYIGYHEICVCVHVYVHKRVCVVCVRESVCVNV